MKMSIGGSGAPLCPGRRHRSRAAASKAASLASCNCWGFSEAGGGARGTAVILGAGGDRAEEDALDGPGAAADEDARGEVEGNAGGALEDGVAAEVDGSETTGNTGGTRGGGAFGGVTGWTLPPAAALGGDATRARFTGREGLVNEKVETVVLSPCGGGGAAAEGAGRFRRSAAVMRRPVT